MSKVAVEFTCRPEVKAEMQARAEQDGRSLAQWALRACMEALEPWGRNRHPARKVRECISGSGKLAQIWFYADEYFIVLSPSGDFLEYPSGLPMLSSSEDEAIDRLYGYWQEERP